MEIILLLVFLVHGELAAADVSRLVVLVHGYDPKLEELRPIQTALEKAGHRVIVFEYDYKKRLDESADRLVDFIRKQTEKVPGQKLSVFGHSMGGLVARRALISGRPKTLADSNAASPIRLVTVATPFGGLFSSNLGMLIPFYYSIVPSHADLASWRKFINSPGQLGKNIEHLKVTTDEAGRQISENGKLVSDSTISEREQINTIIDQDPRVITRPRWSVGHVSVLKEKADEIADLLTREIVPELQQKAQSALKQSGAENNCD